MPTIKNIAEPRLSSVQVTDNEMIGHLIDGFTINVPLVWSWRLPEATPEQRQNFEILGDGQGIRWPDVNEDIRITGMFPALRTVVNQIGERGSLTESVNRKKQMAKYGERSQGMRPYKGGPFNIRLRNIRAVLSADYCLKDSRVKILKMRAFPPSLKV